MLRICLLTMVTAAFAMAVQASAFAQAQGKGTYAGCMANLKKSYPAKGAADWCTRHGYNN
ncbi:MAG TPA: hypothetical protein VGJ01_10440 [Pseudolabrys sp.]|jgi:hypothetical protein